MYVDKTPQILPLIQTGKYIFLSRPRRFGKSLLVSTLKEIFSGNKELFNGLFLYDKIDWSSYPVIHLDISRLSNDNETVLTQSLLATLDTLARDFSITLSAPFLKDRFFELIRTLHATTQKQVVVLIDEYDKPIIDFVEDIDQATRNRDVLKDFYGILKSSDQYLRFVFITGVSKFSRGSIFSDLNNLNDITLDSQYATLLGYTQEELEGYFDNRLDHLSQEKNLSKEQLLAKIRDWYNGYSWNASDRVYNPVSILHVFAKKMFRNYWFATGTPTFLVSLTKQTQQDVAEFACQRVADLVFDSYDITNMNIFALLFQTGYLTVTDVQEKTSYLEYTLSYPNLEVREAFITYLFEGFTENKLHEIQPTADTLRECLHKGNLEGFMTRMRSMFAKIPYTLHIKAEAYYHSLFYMIAALMGVEVDLEVLRDKGRIDGVLEFEDRVYVIEFKYGQAGSDLKQLTQHAIQQIQDKRYIERYRQETRQCFLLGIGFVDKEMEYKLCQT